MNNDISSSKNSNLSAFEKEEKPVEVKAKISIGEAMKLGFGFSMGAFLFVLIASFIVLLIYLLFLRPFLPSMAIPGLMF